MYKQLPVSSSRYGATIVFMWSRFCVHHLLAQVWSPHTKKVFHREQLHEAEFTDQETTTEKQLNECN